MSNSGKVKVMSNLATASDRLKLPEGLDLSTTVMNQAEAIERLTAQLEGATIANHKKEAQIIGLKQQVQDLKIAVSKLKAIKKELRNIIDCQSRELK